MLRVTHRAPGDDFSFLLLQDLEKQIKVPHESMYLWSATLNVSNPEKMILELFAEISQPNVFVCIRDNFNSIHNYIPSNPARTDIADILCRVFELHPDKNFVLATALENVDQEFTGVPNVQILPIGGDITNHAERYKTLDPVLDKNFNSQISFISLNRNARSHRVSIASLLLGLGLERYGKITFIDSQFFRAKDYLFHVNWKFTEEHEPARTLFINGFEKLYDQYHTVPKEEYQIYNKDAPNDNVANFNNVLRDFYRSSFVEIVSETTFEEPSFLLTEKTLNSIYGCNFPIILSGVGSVKFLRQMGMDVFDDVIDHSYDLIEDKVLRLYHAICDNQRILSDPELAKSLWKKNQKRFIKNLDFARNGLYNYYSTRAFNEFSKIKWKE